MPRVKQNCPKKMKWEGGVERPCTPGEDDAESSDGDTSVASGSSGGGGTVPAPTSSIPDEAADVVPVAATAAAARLLQDKELQLAAASSAAALLEHAAKANHAAVAAAAALLGAPDALVVSSVGGGGRELQASPSARAESREPPSIGRSASRASSDLSSGEPKNRHFDSEDENHCTTEEILDFSKKRSKPNEAPAPDPANILNLSKPGAAAYADNAATASNNELSPLDLSCSRKRTAQPLPVSDNVNVKHQRTSEFPKNWNPSNFPFYNNNKATKDEWNGGIKTPIINVKKFPETSKSLNELSKLGEDMFRSQMPPRQTAWQSHWVNKGSMEKNKEVFKCVWCKSSFHTLAQLTTHMKETSHCNSNAPATSQSTNNSKSDLNLIIKETMPLPRKLVRGQDVWLGKGAEQTRQILKCMWCGQSFRSLAEMTSHMQQTQHYTNIISQEQIISWKSSDESASASAGGAKATTSGQSTPTPTPPPSSQQSHVTAVLTCKVCDQAFSSLKDLSAHMVKNSHYKEHIMRSITESGGRRRQNREKRKKSLPVRKLLELERAQHELNSTKNGSEIKKIATTSKISCEKCGEKIDTAIFVEHIRLCVGNSRNLLKSALLSSDSAPPERPDEKTKDTSDSPQATNPTSTSPSVLNAIEKLIEKSFDSRNRQNFQSMPNPNLGSSILKRLGIDESSDYTKPIVDAGNINLIRNYQQASAQLLRGRERSGSESSSRSQTPDRKSNISQQVTPVPANVDDSSQPKPSPDSPLKLEPLPKTPSPSVKERDSPKVSSDDEGDTERPNKASTPIIKSNDRTPSPAESGKSTPDPQPKSPTDPDTPTAKSESSTKSLNALSSMFDNLSGKSGGGGSSENGGGSSGNASGAPGSSHPLAALQKLCDYTDRTSASTVTTASTTNTNPGAILAFTWACNDAMVNNAESAIIKCAFCDTPFISKGAYRHHLSKMHFVKDGNVNDAKTTSSTSASSKASASAPSPPVASTSSESNSAAAAKSPQNSTETSSAGAGAGPVGEESPHSKFLKYTELAKQLSSKYV